MSYGKRKPNPNVQFLACPFQLYPTKPQHPSLWQNSGCKLVVSNYFFDLFQDLYENYGESPPSYKWCCEHLTHVLKTDPDYEWLNQADSTSLQQAIKDLLNAYSRFFKGESDHPKRKKFHRSRRSFRCMMRNELDCNKSRIKIGKHGWFKVKGSWQDLTDNDKIKNITVKVDAGKWFCVVLVERLKVVPTHTFQYEIGGADRNIADPVVTAYLDAKGKFKQLKNNGKEVAAKLKKLEKRRKHLQNQLARKKKGSKNRAKAKAKVAKAYYKERMVRKEFTEQLTCILANLFRIFVVEDLKLSNMTRSAKGTVEAPGTNVAAKSGLNRELLRMGLGYLVTRLEQKLLARGGKHGVNQD